MPLRSVSSHDRSVMHSSRMFGQLSPWNERTSLPPIVRVSSVPSPSPSMSAAAELLGDVADHRPRAGDHRGGRPVRAASFAPGSCRVPGRTRRLIEVVAVTVDTDTGAVGVTEGDHPRDRCRPESSARPSARRPRRRPRRRRSLRRHPPATTDRPIDDRRIRASTIRHNLVRWCLRRERNRFTGRGAGGGGPPGRSWRRGHRRRGPRRRSRGPAHPTDRGSGCRTSATRVASVGRWNQTAWSRLAPWNRPRSLMSPANSGCGDRAARDGAASDMNASAHW